MGDRSKAELIELFWEHQQAGLDAYSQRIQSLLELLTVEQLEDLVGEMEPDDEDDEDEDDE